MSMKAVLVKEPGPSSSLYIGETTKPVPKPDEILVKVKSFGLNRMDVVQRQGNYPPPKGASEILGVEVAGVVVEVGESVKGFKIDDRVCGLLPGGGYSEYAVINYNLAFVLPDSLSYDIAAGFPEAFFTAYQTLHLIGGFQKGQTVLVHAGASGVGSVLIQLAKLAGASKIFFTAGSETKLQYCKSLGGDIGVNYKTTDFASVVLNETDEKGVDLIVDFVGKSYWNSNLRSLKVDGKMVMLAFLSGNRVEDADIGTILRKRLQIIGSTLRSRTVEYQGELASKIKEAKLLEAVQKEELKIHVCKTFKWGDIKLAHDYMEDNLSLGKIIVKVED